MPSQARKNRKKLDLPGVREVVTVRLRPEDRQLIHDYHQHIEQRTGVTLTTSEIIRRGLQKLATELPESVMQL